MKKVILIKTTPRRYHWLDNLMKTLSGYDKYPIFIYSNKSPWWMEPSLFNFLNADEIVLLHDSMEITDTSMFNIVFEEWASENVAFIGSTPSHPSIFTPYSMQLAKFNYELLKKIEYVDTNTKESEYAFEDSFCKQYLELAPNPQILIPDFQINESNAEKVDFLGRTSHKIITKYFTKYRGIVTGDKLKESLI